MLSETLRESAATLQFGIVEEVDDAKALVKVRLPALDDMVTHWLHVLADDSLDDKDYALPDPGTQVAILLDPRGEDGVMLGALYSEADRPPVSTRDKWHRKFSDGTTIEYDRAAPKLAVDAQGDIEIDATGNVTLKAQGDITIESVTGQLKIKSLLPLTVESQSKTIIKAAANIDLDAPLINSIGFLKIIGGIG